MSLSIIPRNGLDYWVTAPLQPISRAAKLPGMIYPIPQVYRVKTRNPYRKKRPEISDLFFCGLQPATARNVYMAEDKRVSWQSERFFS